MENKETLGGLNKQQIDDFKKFFLQDKTFLEHFNKQNEDVIYTQILQFLFDTNTDLSTATRARILAGAWARHDLETAKKCLARGHKSRTNKFGIAEVLRAAKLLDSQRKLKSLTKKLEQLETGGISKPATLGKLRREINDLKQEETRGSLTGSLARFLRRWVGTHSKEDLEFFALSFPKEPWCELADLIHIHPDDFQHDWFLDFCFDKPIPGESMVAQCSNWRKKQPHERLELIQRWKLPYSFIRRELGSAPSLRLTSEEKKAITEYEPIDTIIWYYEDLKAPGVDDIVRDRLLDGDLPTLTIGKLLQRLLDLKEKGSTFYPMLIPFADRMLQSLSLPLEPPVVVIGDASGSMQVAVKTAIIIGGLIACLCNAELRFFDSKPRPNEKAPKSVSEVIALASRVRASGGTANAASLWESYENKQKVNWFIMTTDEEENQAYKSYRWLPLWKKYLAEVHPTSKMVFISFLKNNVKGQMVKEFDAAKMPYLQFVFNTQQPDLSKLDTLLALLTSGAAAPVTN